MPTKYQTKFEINRNDLEIIEKALRGQASKLCLTKLGEQGSPGNEGQLKSQMSDIQSLLGKLHNQKIWFVPEKHVPLG